MNTDELIAALASQVEAVDPRAGARRLWITAAAGIAAATPLMLATLRLNPKLDEYFHLPMFWLRLLFVAMLAAAALWIAWRAARPGFSAARALWWAVLPIAAIWLFAAVTLAQAAPSERIAMILGATWKSCPWAISLLSAPAFVFSLWWMQTLAPTRLRLAGAGAGLLAGTLGALVYTFHCPELAAPFLAVWYLLGMLVPAGAGALVGPRVLRW